MLRFATAARLAAPARGARTTLNNHAAASASLAATSSHMTASTASPCTSAPTATPTRNFSSITARGPYSTAPLRSARPAAPFLPGRIRALPPTVVQVGSYRFQSTIANDADAAPATPFVPLAKRVLVVGSGGLSIGQAGEFDYSGSQAIKALKEEGVETILVNPNIATVQTDEQLADKVYFLPVTPEYVTQIIEKERPDGILLNFGGQTALNCGIALDQMGVLEKYNVKVLGTPISTLITSEDRDLFAKALQEINIPIAKSVAVETVDEALAAAAEIHYPVIVRSAFALGGLGSGFAANPEELAALATKSLALSPQILVERSMKGWKEVEYEVVRDAHDNCITVCNMENLDPLGVHTGDSIVVAPSQTLSDEEYHMLRAAAIKIIRHLGVVGECNVQYALNPDSLEYAVIEVNARLSRSSALASKATGYPLAFVAAKIGLGQSLPEIKNAVTKSTTACFEPSLDYVVTKIPRWDLSKFAHVDRKIGSQMKSVGEVMAIGRTFEESFQKAIRQVDPSFRGFEPPTDEEKHLSPAELATALRNPTDQRLQHWAQAVDEGMTADQIHDITKIDKWFLYKFENMTQTRKTLQSHTLESADKTVLLAAKQAGFSDTQIAAALKPSADGKKADALAVRAKRVGLGITPWVKRIDTLAGEFPTSTNYLYMTYHGAAHDVKFDDNGTMVLGSGVYRIGSSVEFDWCGVSAIRELRDLGRKTIMVNYNPETVSTDFDEADRLYFEELSLERVLDIYQAEQSEGVVVSVGGQLPQNMALPLQKQGCKVLGTNPEDIDRAEDRAQFSAILDKIGVHQPQWQALTTVDEALAFADRVGYPVLVRPSYVLSGAAMRVATSPEELKAFLALATDVSPDHPVVVTEFVTGANEIDVDGVAVNGQLIAEAVSEHVEPAGVHSGDASLVLPAPDLPEETRQAVRAVAAQVAKALNITGPFNMQILEKPGHPLRVIECNLRASRSFPFISKVLGENLIRTATRAMAVPDAVHAPIDLQASKQRPYVAVKAPQFSWTRIAGADPVLSVEMSSTGEVACFGKTQHEAFLTSLEAVNGFKVPEPGMAVLVARAAGVTDEMLATVSKAVVRAGHPIVAADAATAAAITASIKQPVSVLARSPQWLAQVEGGEPLDSVRAAAKADFGDAKVALVLALAVERALAPNDPAYAVRRLAVDLGVPMLTDARGAALFADALAIRREALRAGKPIGPVDSKGQPMGEIVSWNEWIAATGENVV
ncbi:carbamoyl-phosphate synthase (glutamine-hydrolyzing) cpa2 [Allomyces javanicus]|nr:carbamoyl-phosphate synthase (glutamine-hydrolyzing) cpa2 [Allomyces javanicus]